MLGLKFNHFTKTLYDEIAYPSPNFNGANVEVWDWINPTLYWACNYYSMLRSKLIHVVKKGPRRLPYCHWWRRWSLSIWRHPTLSLTITWSPGLHHLPREQVNRSDAKTGIFGDNCVNIMAFVALAPWIARTVTITILTLQDIGVLWPLLLTWINFNLNMDK